MTKNSFLYTTGISLAVSTIVVLVNNYILYRHSCKKSSTCPQVTTCPSDKPVGESNSTQPNQN